MGNCLWLGKPKGRLGGVGPDIKSSCCDAIVPILLMKKLNVGGLVTYPVTQLVNADQDLKLGLPAVQDTHGSPPSRAWERTELPKGLSCYLH